jgi:hypothetical protein
LQTQITVDSFISVPAVQFGQQWAQRHFFSTWKVARCVGKVLSISYRRRNNNLKPSSLRIKFCSEEGGEDEYTISKCLKDVRYESNTEPPEYRNPVYEFGPESEDDSYDDDDGELDDPDVEDHQVNPPSQTPTSAPTPGGQANHDSTTPMSTTFLVFRSRFFFCFCFSCASHHVIISQPKLVPIKRPLPMQPVHQRHPRQSVHLSPQVKSAVALQSCPLIFPF